MVEYNDGAGHEFDLARVTTPAEAPSVLEAKAAKRRGVATIDLAACIQVPSSSLCPANAHCCPVSERQAKVP